MEMKKASQAQKPLHKTCYDHTRVSTCINSLVIKKKKSHHTLTHISKTTLHLIFQQQHSQLLLSLENVK